MQDTEVRERATALDGLLASLEDLADPAAREQATAVVAALVELYGEALARVLQTAASRSPELIDAIHQDELLSQLLLLHDLHPLSITVDQAVAEPGGIGTHLPLFPMNGPAGDSPGTVSLEDVPPPGPMPATNGDADAEEWCELCAEPLAPAHRHMMDVDARELLCACRACSLLFDRPAAGGGHYRLVGDRRDHLGDFDLDDEAWAGLRIPVGMAFFVRAESGEVTGYYPSPAGPTESLLPLDTWADLEERNPVLAEMEPDVEALLVNRTSDPPEHWLVGVDVCYELIGIIRTRWEGFTGGDACWDAVEAFFAELRQRTGTTV